MEISLVLDLGFGDSGKGLVTDYLSKRAQESGRNPLVVRFSGGHQAGHTVVLEDNRHVFSNFCAGTLRGAASYFSHHCAVFPPAILGEREALEQKISSLDMLDWDSSHQEIQRMPILFLDPLAVVTTPFDIAYNRVTESRNQHGSCGLGITATFQRSEMFPLFVQDLKNDWILNNKVKSVRDYYIQKLKNEPKIFNEWEEEIENIDIDRFLEECKTCMQVVNVEKFSKCFQNYDSLIFEGSQGILLDRLHGIYPHVTYANTTSKNVWDLLEPIINIPKYRNILNCTWSLKSQGDSKAYQPISIYYITRAYQTRHGIGPMSEVPIPPGLQPTDPTNQENPFQGALRFAGLDPSLLEHAILIDSLYHSEAIEITKQLVVTCTDHVPGWSPTLLREIISGIGTEFQSIYQSSGPTAEDLKLFDKLIQ
jgi:adenylosuccinate synthase